MKAICLVRETELELRDVPAPKAAADGHLLVQMEGSAINSGDKYFLVNAAARAAFGSPENDVWGASGVGVVTALGPNVPAQYMGKRVAIYRSLVRTPETIGLWCEIAHIAYLSCVILPDGATALDYSGSLVNIITPYAFLNQIKDDGHNGVIATAGSAATGRALLELARHKNVPAIGIVRSEQSKHKLEGFGLTNILALQSATFKSDLETLAAKLGATAVFEGVGGDIVTRLAPLLPRNSTFYFYGFLAGPAQFSMQSRMMLEKGLTMRGFSNFATRTVTDHELLLNILDELSGLIDNPNFRTSLGLRFSYEQIDEALNYKSQNGEKALLVP